MTVDLEQFHQVFFEESFEGLDIMESGLLQLENGEIDLENINTIFRSAHSIKGGSGTFGFSSVADFTHDMETLLDQMRNDQREVSVNIVNTLLACVDVLRNMIIAIKDKVDIDVDRVAELTVQLKVILESSLTEHTSVTNHQPLSSELCKGWVIEFSPHIEMMKTGNDTVRILRELAQLGDSVEITLNNNKLPMLVEINPEECYQSWIIRLLGSIDEEDINEVFAWVEDECDLIIEKLIDKADNEELETIISTDKSVQKQTANEQPRQEKKASKIAEQSSIRVNIDKVDDLINMVGELVITQSMLSQFGKDEKFDPAAIEKLRDGLDQLEQHTRELQENVLRIRMMPINIAFQRFPRLVHDLSAYFEKKIELVLKGEQTELDKTVLEKIGDPLTHLVRNSLDHGIESPAERIQSGKPETGIIELSAYHQGGNIVIQIKDDGAGLDFKKINQKAIDKGLISKDDKLTNEQIADLIFQPGFSTVDVVSDVSGRGVGMDVVRKNIRELGGAVEVKSVSGEGSTFTIRLPLTLAILDGQLVGVGDETYIVPLISIVESIQIKTSQINQIAGNGEVYKLRDEYIPVVRLYEIFGVKPASTELIDGLLVVVEAESKKVAIYIDELLDQQQVVIKSLETNFRKVNGLSGATILGDGTVALIIDVAGLIDLYQNKNKQIVNKTGGGIAA